MKNKVAEMTEVNNKVPSWGWLILSVPWMLNFLLAIINFSIGIMLPSIQAEMGFSSVEAGYLSSFGNILTVILLFPVTALTNRKGPKILLTVAIFFTVATLILQSTTTSYPVLLVFMTLSVGIKVVTIPVLSLVKQNVVPIERIEVVNGMETIMVPLGQIVATLFIPKFLTAISNWRMVYFVVALLVFFVGVLWVAMSKKHLAGVKLEESQSLTFGSDFISVAKQPVIWLAAFAVFGTTMIWTSFFTFWPQFAIEEIHLDLTVTGMIMSLLPIASIVASLSMPHISKALRIEKPFIWIWGFLLPISYSLMVTTDRIPVLLIGSFLAGFGASAFVPFLFSYPYKIPGLSKKEVTIGVSLVSISLMLASGLGPIIISRISQGCNDLGLALKIGSFFPITLAIGGLLLPKKINLLN